MSVSVLTVWLESLLTDWMPQFCWHAAHGSLKMQNTSKRDQSDDVLELLYMLLLPCHCQSISGSQHPASPIVSDNKGRCEGQKKQTYRGQSMRHVLHLQ